MSLRPFRFPGAIRQTSMGNKRLCQLNFTTDIKMHKNDFITLRRRLPAVTRGRQTRHKIRETPPHRLRVRKAAAASRLPIIWPSRHARVCQRGSILLRN